jgi:hypothetical protein
LLGDAAQHPSGRSPSPLPEALVEGVASRRNARRRLPRSAAARWPAFFVAINEATQVMTVTLKVSSATPVKTISPKYFEIYSILLPAVGPGGRIELDPF